MISQILERAIILIIVIAIICGIIYGVTKNKKTGKLIKPLLLSLPIVSFAYGFSCFFDGANISIIDLATKTEYKIFFGVIIMLFIFMILTTFLPYAIIKKIITIRNRRIEKEHLRAMDVQAKREENIAKEWEIKKIKYKPIRCDYCGTYNIPSRTNCKNCGAVLNKESKTPKH